MVKKNYSIIKRRFFMKKISVALILFSFCVVAPVINLSAQNENDPVLITIADENITKSEFLSIYQKNNVNGEVLDKKSLEEYIELFINFKLKVHEAVDLGLDTVPSFINELKGYRDQLAKPYFVDEEVNEELLKQAYNRKTIDVRVSHILVRVEKFAAPEDTLEAYNKIMAIRERIINGEDFNDVAEEVSEDPSARDMPARGFQPARKGNRGDMGYFSVFDMVYPFEEAAYNLPIGEISMPVHTDFGYHLLKVGNKCPALGKVQVAHLFVQMPKEATHEDSVMLEKKVDSIYNAIIQNADYEEMVAAFSDDKSSAENGGVLPWFGSNRMVPEFIDGIIKIKDTSQMVEPILTSYGWHIIKLIDKKPIGDFEDEKADLKQKLAKDPRSKKGKESIIRRIKEENNYKDYPKAISAFVDVIDSTIYKRKWETENAAGMDKVVFKLGDEKYNQQQFAEFISKHQSINSKETISQFVDATFKKFVDEKVIEYEDARLEEIYPEFKALVKEYRDGILLFELTDQKVWTKAIKDTTGLKEFHNNNRDNYMWVNRINAGIFTCDNENIAGEVRKMVQDEQTDEEIFETFNNDTLVQVNILRKKFSPGENPVIDEIKWKEGISKNVETEDGKTVFVVVYGLLDPEPKTLNEARGLITADYQNYLEDLWIKELKKKYTVIVHEEILSDI